MSRYGSRFLQIGEFLRHCKDLNVKAHKEELEHYEKTGVMLPVVRLVKPDQYVIEEAQLRLSSRVPLVDSSRWPELQRLEERLLLVRYPDDYGELTDDELVHIFDREIDTNCLLTRPSAETFRAWDEYRVQIPDVYGGELSQSTVEHYYSYWQVHQLHLIQKFPDLYKNRRLFEYVTQQLSVTLTPNAPYPEVLAEFKGMYRIFDALSYWQIVSSRIQGRTFATVDEVYGVRRLDATQTNDFRTELVARADTVLAHFNLCSDDLYRVLPQLIRLHRNYVKDERYRLAEELKLDILLLSNLIELKIGVDQEQVEAKLNYFDGRTFRHLDEVRKERDYAVMIMKRAAEKCAKDLQGHGLNWSFSDADIHELLDYCEDEGVGLLRTALSGMLATDEEFETKFRRVTRYSNLKSILSSYEYLLKSLGMKGNLPIGGMALNNALRRVMDQESWWQSFQSRSDHQGANLTHALNTTDFLTNLVTIMNDAQLNASVDGYWAQIFLLTVSARNGTVHFYPEEDQYYEELFGTMLNAPLIAMFYSWKFAKQRQWI